MKIQIWLIAFLLAIFAGNAGAQTNDYTISVPFTFYHDVARDAFRIYGGQMNQSASELLQLYLKHPELIENTQKSIDKVGVPDGQVDVPLQNETDFSDKVDFLPLVSADTPVEVMVKKPHFWMYHGDYSLQIMQNYVSDNWYKGGESNYAALGSVSMEANYNNKQKVKWDNKLEMRLGMQNTRTDSLHSIKSTEDLLRLTSKLGLQASKQWYYTLQVIAQSQFTHSYKSNDPVLYSDFFAPFNVNVSLGMDYNVDWINHHLKGNIHLAPLAYNLKYTRLLELSDRLGIDEGKHVLHDLGSQFTVDLEWVFSDELKWKTRLYGYTSYRRAEIEWENTFQLQINRWMSAQLFVYPRFDDSVTRDGHHGYWQFKEFASIGFTYSF